MNILSIDLDLMKESGLFPDEFMLISIINSGINPDLFQWREDMIQSMKDTLWIDKPLDEYILRSKSLEILEKPNNSINFDEFWDSFPTQTNKGRVLRTTSKEWGGKPTRDYLVCKKKYLSKVKTPEAHKKIVEIIKARVISNDTEYMNNLETYINQAIWERDIKYILMVQDWANKRV